jgi:iron(III) transport system substrate-binding protein
MRRTLLAVAALLSVMVSVASVTGTTAKGAREVNLYSYRQEFLIKPLLDAFTRETGIKVNVVYAKTGMLERLKAEGRNSPADAVLTADFGRLIDLVEAGLAQSVRSPILEANIPPQYRHPEGLWFGLTTRARVIYTHKTRVKAGEIASYEDLVAPRFKGRICTRSGKHVYNIALLASIIAIKGAEWAEEWTLGVKANLARRPQGNDRAQVKAIYQGVCDIALGNSYYMGHMATNDKEPAQKEWAAAVTIVFPNQKGRGTHVNVSGALVTKSAKNRDSAVALLTFLTQPFAQRTYAKQNFEYPVGAGVPLHPLVASWGTFKADTVNLAEAARYRSTASRIMDRVAFDN